MSTPTLSPEFQKAVEESRQLKAKPTNDELLQTANRLHFILPQLYGLFKQATQDPPIEKADKPGAFDLKGKAKKHAWQKLVDDGVTPEQAQTKYVELVEKLKGAYGYGVDAEGEGEG
ncbi:MAG: hypothetical protein M1816_000166 [Peltula sp. TS41687]|nr:MAG: hypothetical protein M1816_000166 [Peltula sp. TS41687]